MSILHGSLPRFVVACSIVGLAWGCGTADPPRTTSNGNIGAGANGTPRLSASVENAVAGVITFGASGPWEVRFSVVGTTVASEVGVALISGPTGGALNSSNPLKPVFSLTAAPTTEQQLSLLVRDLKTCAAKSSAAACALPATGATGSGKSYDVVVSVTLKPASSSTTTVPPTTATPPPDGTSGDPGLLARIMGMLGGGSSGSLQQMIGALTGGTGAGGLGALIQQLLSGGSTPGTTTP